ncbi:ndj1p [Saccharomyces arboricola H-6]|uniref:Ndj1p n=1 Tax=Saccharomyces arboricola (strain H-6 / AS 2.3317 / CBS 10644) TaxID=1160507 RepID=J8Q2J6_SACAR|nr:ndj1p [Saccharomyces arboricola H-6]
MSKDKKLASIRLQSVEPFIENGAEFQHLKIQIMQQKTNNLPLEGFISSIYPPMFRDHRDYVFVLYCLNQVDLITDLHCSTKCHYPLQIFKDCQLNSLVQKDFTDYFQFNSHREIDDRDDGDTTLVNVANMRASSQKNCLLKMSIIPRVCSFDKHNSKTYKLVLEYVNRFETILSKYCLEKDFPKIFFNWSKLIESFTELIFRDLLIKWQQWLKLTQPDNTDELSIPTVLRELVTKLAQKYFTFQNSNNTSIDDFTALLLNKNSLSLLDLSSKAQKFNLNFGLWLDCQNGILIFTNGIVRMTDEITDERLKSFVRPAHVLVLEDHPSNEIVNKLMFFIFSAILQCFTNEILEC